MKNHIVGIGTRQVRHLMDHIGQAAFLIDVDGPKSFRFNHINQHLVEETGIDAVAMIGKSPHDFLAPRVADTVVANYEVCRTQKSPHRYVEILELENGQQWWQTTLSPLQFQSGSDEVLQILGIADDITDLKQHEQDLTQSLSAEIQVTDRLRAFANNAMLDAKSDVASMLVRLDMLRDGFVDLGDQKIQQMEFIESLGQDAIRALDRVVLQADKIQRQDSPFVPIDLSHICRDIAALIDPSERITMTFPTEVIMGNWAATQLILRCVMEYAAQRASTQVSVAVSGQDDGFVVFTVGDDGEPVSEVSGEARNLPDGVDSRWASHFETAMGLVTTRGGKISCSHDADTGSVVQFTLPGRALS